MRGRVWILGGTGIVGTELLRQLSRDDLEIITVSRRVGLAQGAGRHVVLDLSHPSTALGARRGDWMVNLTEATSPHHVADAIRAGAVFIETSASADYVLRLRRAAVIADGSGFFAGCVGVAPGLTNLMAHHLLRERAETRHLSIAVELGLGAHAGPGATRWFFENLGAPDDAERDGRTGSHRSAGQRQRFAFEVDRPAVPVLAFPFVERHILAEDPALSAGAVQTYLALSPPWVTHVVRAALKWGLGRVLARRAETLTRIALRAPTMGPSTTRLFVQGLDGRGHESGVLRLQTGEQSRTTAMVIAAVLRSDGPQSTNRVATITDWVTLDSMVSILKADSTTTRFSANLSNNPATVPDASMQERLS